MDRDGFISYSHLRDRELAQALQRGMHELARPWTRRQQISVFRDTTSLSANHDLWSSILGELERSRYFIYLASPEAAASRWVQKEIQFWLDNRSPERILIAVGSGTVHWDPSAGDFDWSRTTALPRMLEGVFRAEPLWVDLVEVRTSQKYSLRQPEFRSAVAALAAPCTAGTRTNWTVRTSGSAVSRSACSEAPSRSSRSSSPPPSPWAAMPGRCAARPWTVLSSPRHRRSRPTPWSWPTPIRAGPPSSPCTRTRSSRRASRRGR